MTSGFQINTLFESSTAHVKFDMCLVSAYTKNEFSGGWRAGPFRGPESGSQHQCGEVYNHL